MKENILLKTFQFNSYRNIVVLTGAGVSVASGIRPFRGKNGYFNDCNPFDGSVQSGTESNKKTFLEFEADLSNQLKVAKPNAAHFSLAEFESRLPADSRFTLITQNIDGLHQMAGSGNIIEIHGNSLRLRCSNQGCNLLPFVDLEDRHETIKYCSVCGASLRRDTVSFGEHIGAKEEWQAKQALRNCDLFVAIGTSGSVSPASEHERAADYAGARTLLLNLDPMKVRNHYFHEEHFGPAENLVPQFFDAESLGNTIE